MYGYIYLIVNNVNGKTYVGQKKLYSKSWNEDGYMGSGVALKSAKNKYGIENFEKFLICFCNSKEELDEKEMFWIAEYRNRGKAEYNLTKGGHSFSSTPWNKGKKMSEESRKKNSDAHKGTHYRKGKPCSEETKQKLSEINKGKIISEETRKRLSEAAKKDWAKRKSNKK